MEDRHGLGRNDAWGDRGVYCRSVFPHAWGIPRDVHRDREGIDEAAEDSADRLQTQQYSLPAQLDTGDVHLGIWRQRRYYAENNLALGGSVDHVLGCCDQNVLARRHGVWDQVSFVRAGQHHRVKGAVVAVVEEDRYAVVVRYQNGYGTAR